MYAMKIIRRSKLLLNKSGDADRQIQELEIMKKLNHKNIVKLHEVINDPSSEKLYLVMDYLPGGTILQLLESYPNGLDLDQVRRYACDLVSALVYCHESVKVIHRDIKPENIMLDPNGNAVLVDFGVSALFQKDDIVKGTVGSLRYFSPEQVQTGKKTIFGRKTDIWALGVTLYQLATNRYPFDANSILKLQS